MPSPSESTGLAAPRLRTVGAVTTGLAGANRIESALAWLESHVNLEALERDAIRARRPSLPTLERITELVGLIGDPQHAYPVIHLTGTNGKGSTARMITSLLISMGLAVGTYTSPNVQTINERLAWNDESIGDEPFAEVLEAVAALERMMSEAPTRFEILTAAAYRWFADIAVDVAVVEVGMGGRWDATNVADADVAVLTNVSFDHVDVLGPTLADIAAEKAGIVKPGCRLLLGENDPDLMPIFHEAEAATVWLRGQDFACDANRAAHGGRLCDLRTPGATYSEVFLPLHGAYQGENAACALAAVEAFFGRPLDPAVVQAGFAAVRSPGRMEVVRRHPLCILDAAHNPAGAHAASAALDEEFALPEQMVMVIGLLRGRDPFEMLGAFDLTRIGALVACPPPSPRALPPEQVAKAASELGIDSQAVDSTAEAIRRGVDRLSEDGMLFVTGSMYLVGEARSYLVG